MTIARPLLLSSPRRRGPIATALSVAHKPCNIGSTRRMGPRLREDDSGEACDQMRQVFPFKIVLFDESNFPIAVPFLQLLFATDGVLRVLIGLDINQTKD